MDTTSRPFALSQLLGYVADIIYATPALSDVWIVAETVDVRQSGGHCYMELVEKDPATGSFIAKARATIWVSVFNRLAAKFLASTGTRFGSGLKVMVRATVNFHPVYGLSLNITDIDPSYTMGDIERRRIEIIDRLTAEGVVDMNRELPWPEPVQRIAVISAEGAAGYGDFIKQLLLNSQHLRFSAKLFPAMMQGERCVASVIAALEQIACVADEFDCVVIIRGGGATSDLVAFDSYELALNITQFPIPVIAGIGHDRDETVIDRVAKMQVKTPTAAAQWLVSHGEEQLARVASIGAEMLQCVTDRIGGYRQQLAWYEAALPVRAMSALQLASNKVDKASLTLASVSDRTIRPLIAKIDAIGDAVKAATSSVLQRATDRVDAIERLVNTLSPQSTLRRGYTITRTSDGKVVTSASSLKQGTEIITSFADGETKSTIIE